MSGRIETFTSEAESSKWSRNESIGLVEAGVDIGTGKGGSGGSTVSVDQVVTEGREVAGVTVDGQRTAILVPNEGAFVQSDWDEDDPAEDAYIKNKPNLADVATSGDYSDLSNTPDLSDFVEDANYVHTDNNYDTTAKTIVDGVTNALDGKVDKVQGKVLSDNNYSTSEKNKLSGLLDIQYVGSGLDLSNNALRCTVPVITVDSALSNSSENPVQNKVITGALADKVDKVSGKVLSDNNYTTSEKDKLAGIDNGAEVNDISTISVNGTRVNPDANKNVDISIAEPIAKKYQDIGTISSGTWIRIFKIEPVATAPTMFSDANICMRVKCGGTNYCEALLRVSYINRSPVGNRELSIFPANSERKDCIRTYNDIDDTSCVCVAIRVDSPGEIGFEVTDISGSIVDTNGIIVDNPFVVLSSAPTNVGGQTFITGSYADLTNKPTLGTAAAKDIPASGDASSTQVVMGDDSRLTDARNAADVYSWAKASSKPSYTATEVGAIPSTDKGSNNGVAELDSAGKVPSSQLPSYVDDVLEYSSTSAFPVTGETGKIYIATDTNKTYRWSGTGYAEISESLALGETSSTAYRGDRGKTAYDHSQSTHARTDATAVAASSTNGNITINGTETTVYTHPGSGTNPHGTTKSDVGLGNVGNFKAVSTEASQGLSSTEQANARANIGAGTSSFSGSYNDLSNKPSLAAVATSGSYNDLSNKPSLATVATSGSYNDLSNKPTIPTVNNATLTIQKNGTNVTTFTANASSDATANITVPTKTSDLTNDSGFVTANNRKSFYGTCDTAADVAAKVITLANSDGWELKAGTIIGVRSTYSNTASNVTFNVNGSGAKSVYYANGVYTSSWSDVLGSANRTIYYMYDGTYWVWVNIGNIINNAVTQRNTTDNKDYRVLFSADNDDTTTSGDARKNTNFKYNPSTQNLIVPKVNGILIGDGSVRYDKTTEKLQFYDNGTWVDLLTIHTAIKAFIGFCTSGTSSSGTFTTYFVDLSYDPVNNTLNFVKLNDSDSYTTNTHTTHSFDSEISTIYGTSKFGYNAQSTPYNSYYTLTADSYSKGLSLSASNDISSIVSALFPLNFSTMTSQTSGTNWGCNSSSGNISNKIIGISFKKSMI